MSAENLIFKTQDNVAKSLLEGALGDLKLAVILKHKTQNSHFNFNFFNDSKLLEFNNFLHEEIMVQVNFFDSIICDGTAIQYDERYINELKLEFKHRFDIDLFEIYNTHFFTEKKYNQLIRDLKWEHLKYKGHKFLFKLDRVLF